MRRLYDHRTTPRLRRLVQHSQLDIASSIKADSGSNIFSLHLLSISHDLTSYDSVLLESSSNRLSTSTYDLALPGTLLNAEPLAATVYSARNYGGSCFFSFALDNDPAMADNAFQLTGDNARKRLTVIISEFADALEPSDIPTLVISYEARRHLPISIAPPVTAPHKRTNFPLIADFFLKLPLWVFGSRILRTT